MRTSHFDYSALPPARTFYESQLGEIRRPNSQGWASPKSGCPFHESESKTSFRVNLNTGAFHCYGCGIAGGGLMKFAMLYHKVDAEGAGRLLGIYRDHISPEAMKRIQQAERRKAEKTAREQQELAEQRGERISARDHLHAVETLYREAIEEHDWSLMPELLPRVRQAEERYCQLAGLEVWHEW